MGLRDALPDGVEPSSSSSKSQSSSEKKVKVGTGNHQKVFTEDKWERVKKVITREFGMMPQEVIDSKSQKEAYEIIHEAALIDEKEKTASEADNYQSSRCASCGTALAGNEVEIGGKSFCPNHPAIKVKKVLEEDGN